MTGLSEIFDYGEAILACSRGDRHAFRQLYDQDAPRLLGVALRIVRRRDMAEEVVHEVFLVIWRNAKSFDPSRGSGRAWLSTIARNISLNKIRGLRPTLGLEAAEVEAIPDSADHPDRMLERIQDGALLKNCLQQLDEMKRSSILLAFVDGYSQSEVAARLGVPHNTAKAWIRRGLLRLRECLQ